MDVAIRDIAAAGCAGVEMFDRNLRRCENRPGVLRRLLDDSGLVLVAVCSGANFVYRDILKDGFWRIEKVATPAPSFGTESLVVGGGAKHSIGTTHQGHDRLAESLDRITEIAERVGLRASYHPHLTTIMEGPEEIDKTLSL